MSSVIGEVLDGENVLGYFVYNDTSDVATGPVFLNYEDAKVLTHQRRRPKSRTVGDDIGPHPREDDVLTTEDGVENLLEQHFFEPLDEMPKREVQLYCPYGGGVWWKSEIVDVFDTDLEYSLISGDTYYGNLAGDPFGKYYGAEEYERGEYPRENHEFLEEIKNSSD